MTDQVSHELPLRLLRYNRTRACNRAKATMGHMLTSEAKWTSSDGLPTWWPFWSDCLVKNVVTCVRAARDVAEAEGHHVA